MRSFYCCVVFFALVCSTFVAQAADQSQPIGPYLQKVSVNVVCPSGAGSYNSVQGSGTLIKDKTADKKSTTWVLTAHHVVKDLREVKTVIDSNGEEKKQISYRDAKVIQEQVDDGRGVGEQNYDARVVSVDPRRDIALLQVRYGEFAKEDVVFYSGEEIPLPGTRLYHCGAPGGKEIGGTCSLTSGIVSRIGVRIPEFGGSEHGLFDQATCPALGGSSGGLVALEENGQWVGMITLGLQGADSFHWMVPVRSILEWSKDVKVEWLFNQKLPRPTQEQIDQIDLELNPTGFTTTKTKSEGTNPTPALIRPDINIKKLPFINIRRLPSIFSSKK